VRHMVFRHPVIRFFIPFRLEASASSIKIQCFVTSFAREILHIPSLSAFRAARFRL